jgi:hypothetical protein
MKRFALGVAALLVAGTVACSKQENGLQIPTGSDVSVEKRDGVTVSGRLIEVQPQEVVLETRDGEKTRVPRSEILALRTVPASPASAETAQATSGSSPVNVPTSPEPPASSQATGSRSAKTAAPAPAGKTAAIVPKYREVTVPAGTVLPIELRTTVGSETSRVEDQVRGTIRRAVTVDEAEVIPAGAVVTGTVTEAARSGRVKGLARVAFRFSTLDLPGDAENVSIRTAAIAREAQPTKKTDAAKIGGGAAAGAVIGGLLGGGDGAAKGAAVGGAAGTGVVLSTRGKEVTVPAGTSVSAKLLQPVTLRVRLR